MVILSLPNNKIKEIPSEISNLKNLELINLKGNPIEIVPEELKYLDKSNGGSLFSLTIGKKDVNENTYNKIKSLLPNVEINYE